MRITGYTYRADNYCPDCLNRELTPTGHNQVSALGVEDMLDKLAEAAGIDRGDEYTFDSDDFPKVVLSVDDDGITCGQCGEAFG